MEREAKGQKRERDGDRGAEIERKKEERALESRGKCVIERSPRTISCGIIFLIGVVRKGSDFERFIDSALNGLWEICL